MGRKLDCALCRRQPPARLARQRFLDIQEELLVWHAIDPSEVNTPGRQGTLFCWVDVALTFSSMA